MFHIVVYMVHLYVSHCCIHGASLCFTLLFTWCIFIFHIVVYMVHLYVSHCCIHGASLYFTLLYTWCIFMFHIVVYMVHLYVSHCCIHGASLSSYLSKIVPTINTTLSLYSAYCWKIF
jgi:hypothetical protein